MTETPETVITNVENVIEALGNVIKTMKQAIAELWDSMREIAELIHRIWQIHSTVPCKHHPRERKCRAVRLGIDKRRFIKAMKQGI